MPLIEDAAALIRSARYVAVLTGAGISAESGIPTFREALTGLWASYDDLEYRPQDRATEAKNEQRP